MVRFPCQTLSSEQTKARQILFKTRSRRMNEPLHAPVQPLPLPKNTQRAGGAIEARKGKREKGKGKREKGKGKREKGRADGSEATMHAPSRCAMWWNRSAPKIMFLSSTKKVGTPNTCKRAQKKGGKGERERSRGREVEREVERSRGREVERSREVERGREREPVSQTDTQTRMDRVLAPHSHQLFLACFVSAEQHCHDRPNHVAL